MYIKYTVVKYRIFTYIVKLKDIRKKWQSSKKNHYQPKSVYSAKLSFRNKHEKLFLQRIKIWKITHNRTSLNELLKNTSEKKENGSRKEITDTTVVG